MSDKCPICNRHPDGCSCSKATFREEVARLKAKACDEIKAHINRRLAAEAKLRAVGELPGKWRKAVSYIAVPTGGHRKESEIDPDDCADELESLLK